MPLVMSSPSTAPAPAGMKDCKNQEEKENHPSPFLDSNVPGPINKGPGPTDRVPSLWHSFRSRGSNDDDLSSSNGSAFFFRGKTNDSEKPRNSVWRKLFRASGSVPKRSPEVLPSFPGRPKGDSPLATARQRSLSPAVEPALIGTVPNKTEITSSDSGEPSVIPPADLVKYGFPILCSRRENASVWEKRLENMTRTGMSQTAHPCLPKVGAGPDNRQQSWYGANSVERWGRESTFENTKSFWPQDNLDEASRRFNPANSRFSAYNSRYGASCSRYGVTTHRSTTNYWGNADEGSLWRTNFPSRRLVSQGRDVLLPASVPGPVSPDLKIQFGNFKKLLRSKSPEVAASPNVSPNAPTQASAPVTSLDAAATVSGTVPVSAGPAGTTTGATSCEKQNGKQVATEAPLDEAAAPPAEVPPTNQDENTDGSNRKQNNSVTRTHRSNSRLKNEATSKNRRQSFRRNTNPQRPWPVAGSVPTYGPPPFVRNGGQAFARQHPRPFARTYITNSATQPRYPQQRVTLYSGGPVVVHPKLSGVRPGHPITRPHAGPPASDLFERVAATAVPFYPRGKRQPDTGVSIVSDAVRQYRERQIAMEKCSANYLSLDKLRSLDGSIPEVPATPRADLPISCGAFHVKLLEWKRAIARKAEKESGSLDKAKYGGGPVQATAPADVLRDQRKRSGGKQRPVIL